MMNLVEIKALVAKHKSSEFNDRIFEDPPLLQIRIDCTCGAPLPPFTVGWKELYRSAENDEAIPERISAQTCYMCAPKESDGGQSVKVLIDVPLSKEGIDEFWEAHPMLREIDHEDKSPNPYTQCIVREIAAALEMEGLISGEIRTFVGGG